MTHTMTTQMIWIDNTVGAFVSTVFCKKFNLKKRSFSQYQKLKLSRKRIAFNLFRVYWSISEPI